MKKISTLLLWVLSLFTLQAQEKPFTQWAAGINGGLYGAGIQGATNLSPHFKLRAGFDYFALNRQDVATFEAEMEDYDQTVEAEITKASVTFPNCKVMIDYYPMRNGIFSLTAGFYTGTNRAEADGMIPGYEELTQEMGEKPTLEYEDIVFEPYDDGSFDALLKMGNSLKPYLGIGLGRSIPKNRVGVRFELGLVYQGKYKLESDNLNEAGRDWVNRMADELELPVSQETLNWWPMLNLSVSYRIR
ncbi:MAG: hypothetical protein PHZ13_12870 [bacterium]|jgi:hypothetical protein|uniref:hypothetical protein n=1 Tax=Petrimonas mucosa TaxID=1642646 RepID=UPI001769AEEC|nr:hypothetical protein [Petrimonas mucosa]MDD2329155.1 hypothetical protein [bacterium]MDD3969548.1 hypothetical protein [Proteiniphilum sp.]MDD4460627.1 hypothetical protein [Proteiniphilum sp.]HHT30491.1 hypothetical protein [Petrimonas mucosa]